MRQKVCISSGKIEFSFPWESPFMFQDYLLAQIHCQGRWVEFHKTVISILSFLNEFQLGKFTLSNNLLFRLLSKAYFLKILKFSVLCPKNAVTLLNCRCELFFCFPKCHFFLPTPDIPLAHLHRYPKVDILSLVWPLLKISVSREIICINISWFWKWY